MLPAKTLSSFFHNKKSTGSNKILAPIVLHEFSAQNSEANDSRSEMKINETKLICGREMSKVQFLGTASNVFVYSILQKHRLICICSSSAAARSQL
jgi:hypothetical protein